MIIGVRRVQRWFRSTRIEDAAGERRREGRGERRYREDGVMI
jgi:hypothetical protein